MDTKAVPTSGNSTTLIFGSYVLARRDGAQEVLRDHWVLLEGNRIAAVTPTPPAGADRLYDRPGRFVLPGLLNLHNHCFSEAVARTHTEDGAGRKNNQSIVYTVLLPLTKRGIEILDPAERLDVARLGILQLLKGGNATVMEPFRNGIPEMFDAALEMGIRFYGAPYLFSSANAQADDSGVVRYAPARDGADDGEADLRTWDDLYSIWNGRDNGRIRLAMSPHATDTCGPDLLRAAAARARARALEVPVTTHLAQSKSEVAVIRSRYNRTPAEYLDWLGVLEPDLLAAHCIDCSDDDLRLMAMRGATVLNCPRVFARAGATAAFGRFAAFGIRTLVGTDGYNMDLLGELNAAAMISKLAAGRAEVACAPELIDAVTVQAAAAIKRPDLGAITPGATADLTVVDLSHPHLQPLFDPRRALIWLANRANIDMVVVDGRVLIEAGLYTRGDEATITAAGAAAIKKIWNLPEAQAAPQTEPLGWLCALSGLSLRNKMRRGRLDRIVFLNGNLVQFQVPVRDRGFLFADGVYEVSAVLRGALVDNEAHLARLGRSLDEIRIANPYAHEQWTQRLMQARRTRRLLMRLTWPSAPPPGYRAGSLRGCRSRILGR